MGFFTKKSAPKPQSDHPGSSLMALAGEYDPERMRQSCLGAALEAARHRGVALGDILDESTGFRDSTVTIRVDTAGQLTVLARLQGGPVAPPFVNLMVSGTPTHGAIVAAAREHLLVEFPGVSVR